MGNKPGIEHAAFGLQGRRPTMEDAEATIVNYGGKPNQALFGIFDGHVGPQCSKYVSSNLPKLLLKEADFASNPKQALTNAFFKVDKDWLTKAKAANPILKDGSTGVVVLLKDDKVYCANTGDSRSVMYQGGKVVPLSFDQKPEDPAEQRRFVSLFRFLSLPAGRGEMSLNFVLHLQFLCFFSLLFVRSARVALLLDYIQFNSIDSWLV